MLPLWPALGTKRRVPRVAAGGRTLCLRRAEPGGSADAVTTMRSNASGVGTGIALRVGSHWGIASTLRPRSGPGQDIQPLSLGIGTAAEADFAAIDWSDGVSRASWPWLRAVAPHRRDPAPALQLPGPVRLGRLWLCLRHRPARGRRARVRRGSRRVRAATAPGSTSSCPRAWHSLGTDAIGSSSPNPWRRPPT